MIKKSDLLAAIDRLPDEFSRGALVAIVDEVAPSLDLTPEQMAILDSATPEEKESGMGPANFELTEAQKDAVIAAYERSEREGWVPLEDAKSRIAKWAESLS